MIKIYNSISNDFISINNKTLDVFVNETRLPNLNHIEIRLLYYICNHNNSILTYDDITRDIVHKFNPDIYDIVNYTRKQKHNICKVVKKFNKHIPRIIETISKRGYKLDSNWSLVQDNNSDKFLSELFSIITTTIQISTTLPLIKTDDKEMITILDVREIADLISENLHIYSDISKGILESLNLNEYEFRYISIATLLQEIRSYISFSRTGPDIEEKQWKSYFYEELMLHYKKLLILANDT